MFTQPLTLVIRVAAAGNPASFRDYTVTVPASPAFRLAGVHIVPRPVFRLAGVRVAAPVASRVRTANNTWQ